MTNFYDVTIGGITRLDPDNQVASGIASQPPDSREMLRVLGDSREGVQVQVIDELQLMSLALSR